MLLLVVSVVGAGTPEVGESVVEPGATAEAVHTQPPPEPNVQRLSLYHLQTHKIHRSDSAGFDFPRGICP